MGDRSQPEGRSTPSRRAGFDLTDPHLTRILEIVPSGVLIVRSDGEIVFANEAAEQMLMPPGERIVGRSFRDPLWEVLQADGTPMALEDRPYTHVLRTGLSVRNQELLVRRSDGVSIVGLINAGPVIDREGTIVGVISAFSDITDLKRAESTLRESEERLRLALEAADMGTFDWDVVNDTVTWSPGHERLWGYAPGEFDGAYESFAKGIHPDDQRRVRDAVRRSVDERSRFEEEYRVLWPDGSVHWVLGTGDFALGPDGEPVRMRGVVVETTARREAQEALRESRERLRLLMQQAETVREEEAQRIAHELHDELGQALTGLKLDLAGVDRLLRGSPGEAEIAEARDGIATAMRDVDATVDAVRRISTELRPSVLDDLGLAAAIEWKAQEFEQRTGIECSVSVEEGGRLDSRAATVLFRCLSEALTNVVRHADASRVDISFTVKPDSVALEVADDGRGVAPEVGVAPGAYGLIGMRERARALGGRLVLSSGPKRGLTVRVWLPIPEARA